MNSFKADPLKTETPSSYPTGEMKELFEAITSINSLKEAINFFRDLLTLAEIKEFSNRWQIVKMLYRHKPYIEIAKKLNVSTATITRVAQWLNDGMGGYKAVAKRMFPVKFTG